MARQVLWHQNPRDDFTAEPPEYWSNLFAIDADLVVALYPELLRNTTSKKDDLILAADLFEPVNAKQVRLVYKKANTTRSISGTSVPKG